MAAFKPYWPARTAAEYPPGPLPMMIRSYVILLLYLNIGLVLSVRFQTRQAPSASSSIACIPFQSYYEICRTSCKAGDGGPRFWGVSCVLASRVLSSPSPTANLVGEF